MSKDNYCQEKIMDDIEIFVGFRAWFDKSWAESRGTAVPGVDDVDYLKYEVLRRTSLRSWVAAIEWMDSRDSKEKDSV